MVFDAELLRKKLEKILNEKWFPDGEPRSAAYLAGYFDAMSRMMRLLDEMVQEVQKNGS